MPDPHDHLAKAIADACVLRGTFTLRSGRTSSYYIDKYLFSTKPGVLKPLGELFAMRINRIAQETPGGIHRLAGAELGGIPLVTVAAMASNLPSIFIRNAKKDYGTAKRTEGVLSKGDNVIFIEDVATTGGQALEAVSELQSLGANVKAVITTIDRQEGARENIEKAGIRFEALFTKADLGITE